MSGRNQELTKTKKTKPTKVKTKKVREVFVQYGPRSIEMPERLHKDEFITVACKLVKDHTREHMLVIHLDSQCAPIGYSISGIGTFDRVHQNSRGILQQATLLGASGLVMGHNHPEGPVTPSAQDFKARDVMKKKCEMFGLTLVDSIVWNHKGQWMPIGPTPEEVGAEQPPTKKPRKKVTKKKPQKKAVRKKPIRHIRTRNKKNAVRPKGIKSKAGRARK
jgi:DNA repair protein RadC